jgi:hypothetical protein
MFKYPASGGLVSIGIDFGNDFCLAGDSRTANNSTVLLTGSSRRRYNEAAGPVAVGNVYANARVMVQPTANYGVGGDTSTMLLARFDAVLADPAMNIALWISANDRGSANMTFQQSKDNITAMLDRAEAVGKRVFLANEAPYGTLTGQQLANHLAMRDWLGSVTGALAFPNGTRRPNVISVNTWEAVCSPTDPTQWDTGKSVDQLHQTTSGGTALGLRAWAPVLKTAFPYTNKARVLHGTVVDSYDSVTNPKGILNPNPLMTGTGGTKGTNVTGAGADNSNTSISGSTTGLSAVISKETDINGIEWQVIVLSGTVTSTTGNLAHYQTLTGLNAGDTIDGSLLIKYEGCSNIIGAYGNISYTDASGNTHSNRSLDGYDATRSMDSNSIRTQVHAIPKETLPSAATNPRINLFIDTAGGNAVIAGTIKVARMSARKV